MSINLFWRELRAGRKAFFIWLAVMFLLCFAGIVKYESYSAGGGITKLMEAFPKPVLAVMGITGIDVNTLSGYTALLYYYIILCVAVYAVHLGFLAAGREAADKTSEFLFAKPLSRKRILSTKLLAAYSYLFLFCLCTGLFALLAAANLKANINLLVAVCSLAAFLAGSLFLALGTLFTAFAKRPEKGSLYGNLAFVAAFILAVILNKLINPGIARLFSPLSYFPQGELAAGRLSLPYAGLTLGFTFLLLFFSFRQFNKRDLVG